MSRFLSRGRIIKDRLDHGGKMRRKNSKWVRKMVAGKEDASSRGKENHREGTGRSMFRQKGIAAIYKEKDV